MGQGNERKEGWAWVDTQPGQDTEILEAYRLADLVSNTLRLEVRPGVTHEEGIGGLLAYIVHGCQKYENGPCRRLASCQIR